MVCLLAFFALPMIVRLTPFASEDLVDGIHGALLGAAIGLMVLSGVRARRVGRCGDGLS
jgi:hypothetical protein